ncbi:hypothetical protein CPB83DRAFT_814822 [Crepidotus variabilis]|uniref:Uncharacterized protein n=1 Tax=Crepidotus variabilis TaxID=179855 RepID=A0A9P6EEC9_9AGAR|nr:hypothetical protein CPB83DRAFT_814822 [Crepidotus variabilis]
MFPVPSNYPSQQPATVFSPSIPPIPPSIPYNSGTLAHGPSDATGYSHQYLSHNSLNGYLSQSQDTLLSGPDMNSPDAFRENIHTALGEVEKLQLLARTVLTSIQSAYQPGIAPHHTEANITRLQEQLALTIEILRQSGVGALPLAATSPRSGSAAPMQPIPSEPVLLESVTRNLEIFYDQLQRRQESAGVVVNLLGTEREKAGVTVVSN